MKRFILSALFFAALVAQPLALWAKDAAAVAPNAGAEGAMKLLAVVAVEGYDDLLSDIGFVGQLTDRPDLGPQQIEAIVSLFLTGGQGVRGLDKKRPWGGVVNTDGAKFQSLAFLPVSSLKQVLASFAPVLGEAKPNGDVFEIRKNNQSLFLKEVNGWAFIGQSPDDLTNLPKDPLALISPLTKIYDVAVQIKVQNIPAMFREFAIAQLQENVQRGIEKDDDETPQEFDKRKKMVTAQIQALVDAINDTDQVTLGWALDSKTPSSFLDLQILAVPGSKIARQLSQPLQTPTAFSGFLLPDAALAFNASGKVPAEDQARIADQLDVLKTKARKEVEDSDDIKDDDKETVKGISGDLIDALKKTIASGKMDAGGAVLLDETLSAAFGFYVSDPLTVEKALKKLAAAAAKENPGAPRPKFDAEKFGGVRFHTLKIPVSGNEKAADILGDNLDVALGFGEQTLYLAMGKQGMPTLKGILEKPSASGGKPLPPFQLTAGLTSILAFVDENAEAPAAGALATEGKKYQGKDHIRLRATSDKYGVTYHLEIEEGVLKVLSQISKVQTKVQVGAGGR